MFDFLFGCIVGIVKLIIGLIVGVIGLVLGAVGCVFGLLIAVLVIFALPILLILALIF